jgi:hypothetical protein
VTLKILNLIYKKAEKFLAKNHYILLELYITLMILNFTIKRLKSSWLRTTTFFWSST